MKARAVPVAGSLLMAGAGARLFGAVLMVGLLWLAVGWASLP